MANMLPIVVKVLAPILAGRKTDDPVYLNFHFHYFVFNSHGAEKEVGENVTDQPIVNYLWSSITNGLGKRFQYFQFGYC